MTGSCRQRSARSPTGALWYLRAVTQIQRLCLAALGALVAATAAGCGSESDSAPDAGAPDAARGPDAASPDAAPDAAADLDPHYEVTGEVQLAAVRGGDDGDPFSLICRTGYVAVGLEGSTGRRVDTIELQCREVLENGSLGDDIDSTARAGVDSQDPYSLACPDGEAIVAIRGREDDSDIRAIGIDCAPVVPWVDEGRGYERGDELLGSSRGDDFIDHCSRGFFVAAVDGHHADIIHGLQVRCDRVADINDDRTFGPYERGTETEELPPRGGADARTAVLECKDDELPIGYVGRAGDRLDRLQLVCGRLAEDGGLTESGTSVVEGGTGGEEFEEYCPEDEAIVGLRGASGSQIDSLGLVCAPVAGWLEDGTGVHPWGRLRGGTGGSDFEDVCPEGMFLRDISAYTDGVFEALTGRCVASETID